MPESSSENGAPQNDLASPPPTHQPSPNSEPRKVLPQRGFVWLVDGIKLFFQYPGAWLALLAFGSVIVLLGQQLPIVGPLFYYATHFIWIAGLMACCRALHQGQSFQFQRLFEGFKSGARTLMSLSLMYTVIDLSLVSYFTEPFLKPLQNSQLTQQELQQLMQNPDFFKALMWSRLAILPVQMAMVFTPALVLFQRRSLLSAIQMSFAACLKNLPAMIVYLLSLLVLSVLATLPAFLGWIVLIPAIIASVYFAYLEMFEATSPTKDYLVV